MSKRILVAMSGGVDSAVTALKLLQDGYELGGITMKVWDNERDVTDTDDGYVDQNCADAREIADALSIPHYVVSLGTSFRLNVIDRFISDYLRGATPNPCVECNKHIKFGKLYEAALSLGYDTLATGHYARIVNENGKYLLKRAVDEKKDQSYFLWAINKELLPHLCFPLGDYTKDEIRAIAKDNNISAAHRADSQDICFISDGDYASFIKSNSEAEFSQGSFIDVNGNVIGEHSGIINYTIGQRKGLGVAFGVPMFVGEKNTESNTVMLCTDEQLYKDTLTATDVNILTDETFEVPVRLQAKIRYRHTPASATVTRIDGDRLLVKFDLPQRAIAKGQSVVLYDGDVVVGGGIIE